jgi:hypothetical protein
MPQESTSSPLGAILRYIRILWKRRLLVGFGSVLPALMLAGAMYFRAGTYKVSFVYERPLTESEYIVLLRRFYSSENLGKIAGVLREKGLADNYAGQFDKAQTEESLQQLVGFKVFPAYPRRLQTTDPLVSERISAFQARLLYVDIRGNSRQNMQTISDVVTANIENVLPIYDVRTDLKEAIRQAKTQVTDIEDRRFTISLDLQQEQARLAAMKKVEDDATAAGSSLNAVGPQGGIILQVTNDPNNRELLPWSYQVRAVQARIIDLQQSLAAGQQRYDYYLRIMDLNSKLLDKVEQSLLKYYTIREFVGFLQQELDQYKDTGVADYMRSYIRKTQNRILINTRAGEKPIVYPVEKDAVRGGALAFIVLLMATSFIAVALEYQNGRGKQT